MLRASRTAVDIGSELRIELGEDVEGLGEIGDGDPVVADAEQGQRELRGRPLERQILVEREQPGLGREQAAEVDLREANEIYELRLLLEPMALARAVAAGDDAYRASVRSAWEALAEQRVAPPAVHAAFHRALLSACDSAWLLRLATLLADRAGLMVTSGVPGRPPDYDTSQVHRTLMDLAVAGDAAGASAELERHLRRTLAALHALAG